MSATDTCTNCGMSGSACNTRSVGCCDVCRATGGCSHPTPDPTGPDEREALAKEIKRWSQSNAYGYDRLADYLIERDWTRTPRPVTVSEEQVEDVIHNRMSVYLTWRGDADEGGEHWIECPVSDLVATIASSHLSSGQSEADMHPTKLTRAVGPGGQVWAESSNEAEVRRLARPDDRIERLWCQERQEWRAVQ